MEVTVSEPRALILAELEALRKACSSGVLSPEDMERLSPALVRRLGQGDKVRAWDELQTIEFDPKVARYLDAVLVSFGFGPYTGNQTERWDAFLSTHFPDVANIRTARRWCDLGFELIAEKVVWEEADVRLSIVLKDGDAPNTVTFQFAVAGLATVPDQSVAWFDLSHFYPVPVGDEREFGYKHHGTIDRDGSWEVANVRYLEDGSRGVTEFNLSWHNRLQVKVAVRNKMATAPHFGTLLHLDRVIVFFDQAKKALRLDRPDP